MAIPNSLKSLLGGMIMTIILVVVIPFLTVEYISPVIDDLIGDTNVSSELISISSSVIAAVVMLLIMVLFMILLGGGAIVRRFGIIGVAGLVIAYYLLDDIYGCILPICIIILFAGISYIRDKKK